MISPDLSGGGPQLISFALSFYNDFFRLSSVDTEITHGDGAIAALQQCPRRAGLTWQEPPQGRVWARCLCRRVEERRLCHVVEERRFSAALRTSFGRGFSPG